MKFTRSVCQALHLQGVQAVSMKEYLGDSVYVDFDGYNIVLTTENGTRGASNVIIMEPEVAVKLRAFSDKVAAMFRAAEGKGHCDMIGCDCEEKKGRCSACGEPVPPNTDHTCGAFSG